MGLRLWSRDENVDGGTMVKWGNGQHVLDVHELSYVRRQG
jgi:hypothetical protein